MIDKKCPYCNKRLSEFYNDGFLGCPNCYRVFRDEILNSLENCQGDNFHVGKTPKNKDKNNQLLIEYGNLLKLKETARRQGRFEDELRITKNINELYLVLKNRGLI